jgi:hypothetical protein
MKVKLSLAIITVICLVLGGVLHDTYIKYAFNKTAESIEKVEEDGIYEIDEIIRARDQWRKHERVLTSLLPHYSLNEIELIFGEIIGSLELRDNKSALAQMSRMKAACWTLEKTFTFRLENVL